MDLGEEITRYRRDLAACVRLQDPSAYRTFVQEWSGLIQRGAVERLVGMDDDALAVRLARMALDDSGLSDVHPRALATLRQHGIVPGRGLGEATGSRKTGKVRLRRPRSDDARGVAGRL